MTSAALAAQQEQASDGSGGKALFTLCCMLLCAQTVMPYPTDYYRFTAEGSELLLKETGFQVRTAQLQRCCRRRLPLLPRCVASAQYQSRLMQGNAQC